MQTQQAQEPVPPRTTPPPEAVRLLSNQNGREFVQPAQISQPAASVHGRDAASGGFVQPAQITQPVANVRERNAASEEDRLMPLESQQHDSSSSIQPRCKPKEAKPSNWIRIKSWLSELLFLLSGLLCLIGILAILFRFDGQQQPQWGYTLSLNTVIALLATVLRSTIMQVVEQAIGQTKWLYYQSTHSLYHVQLFEDASRGPWGSLKFLLKLIRCTIPILGAFITILSLGINTFTQQSLRSVSCQLDAPGQHASIPVAQAAIEDTRWTYQEDPNTDYNSDFNGAMKAAMIGGLANLQIANSLSFNCPSGNCSFASNDGITYSTLVLDGECVDISNYIVQTDFGNFTNYTLPSLGTLTYGWNFDRDAWFDDGGHEPNQDLPIQWEPPHTIGGPYLIAASNPSGSLAINYTTPLLSATDFAFFMPTTSPCQDPSDYPLYKQEGFQPLPRIDASKCGAAMPKVSTLPGFYSLTAVACKISPVLQQYHGSVVNGQLKETSALNNPISLQSVESDPTMDIVEEGKTSPRYFTFIDPCYIDHRPYTASNISFAPGKIVNVTNQDGVVLTGPDVCFYGVSYHWASSLDRLTLTYFTDDSCIATPNETDVICDDWWLEGLFNGRNSSLETVTAAVKAAAQSMSDRLRNNGADWEGSPTSAVGTVQLTSICVKLSWPWLIFPVALVLAVSGVLAAVMAQTHTTADKRGLWKGSILPLLIYGLEDGLKEAQKESDLMSEKNMADNAKSMSVSFYPEQGKWRFRTGGARQDA